MDFNNFPGMMPGHAVHSTHSKLISGSPQASSASRNESNGADRNRTDDLLIANEVL
jgi:hypothetical protein